MTNGHNLNPGDPAPEGAESPCDCCDGPVSDNGLGDCRNECKYLPHPRPLQFPTPFF